MNKEEIKEYLQRVEELELKLVREDRDTLQWLIFGYNECARLLNETEEENQHLKEIEKEHQRINGELREKLKIKQEIIEEVRECMKENRTRYIYQDNLGEDWCFEDLDVYSELLQILDKGESNE